MQKKVKGVYNIIILEEQKKQIEKEKTPRSRETKKQNSRTVSQQPQKIQNPILLSDDEEEVRAVHEVVGQGRREDDADQWRKELRAKAKPRTIRQKSDIEQRYYYVTIGGHEFFLNFYFWLILVPNGLKIILEPNGLKSDKRALKTLYFIYLKNFGEKVGIL